MTTDREAAARAATPGPWFAGKYGSVHPGGRGGSICQMGSKSGLYPNFDENARHIALNDPATILADIDRMKRLEAVAEAAERAESWLDFVYSNYGLLSGSDMESLKEDGMALCAALASLKEVDHD